MSQASFKAIDNPERRSFIGGSDARPSWGMTKAPSCAYGGKSAARSNRRTLRQPHRRTRASDGAPQPAFRFLGLASLLSGNSTPSAHTHTIRAFGAVMTLAGIYHLKAFAPGCGGAGRDHRRFLR